MKTGFQRYVREIPGLDGLRAIAILLVFAYHSHLIEFGWAGVQLFFVLSGFLITGILLDMKESLPVREYFTTFYGRRILRIFPLYYFYLALMVIIAYWLMRAGFRPKYMQIFFDQVGYAFAYIYDLFYRINGFQPSQFLDHFWSLSVEEQFYILWPLLLLFFPQKHLNRLFILFIGMGFVFRLLLYWVYVSGSDLWTFREPFELVIYSWPFSQVDAFGLGAYISRYKLWCPKGQLLFLSLLVPLAGFTATYLASGQIGLVSSLGYDLPLRVHYQFIWGPTLLNYFFAVLIYCVVRERIFLRFLDLSWLRYLGRISYGMYVYHFPILWFVAKFVEERRQGESAFWVNLVVSLALTILISALSYHLLEMPILSLKNRYFRWSPTAVKKNLG